MSLGFEPQSTCLDCEHTIWLWSDKMWHDSDDKVDCYNNGDCHTPVLETPCNDCDKLIDTYTHIEELGMCVDCSNAYYAEEVKETP